MSAFAEEMRAAGHYVSEWSNEPGDRYSLHSHPYKKVLCCLQGSIDFHLADRDVALREGDQVELDPGVEHSATVGPSGVRCAEAHLT
jgi:quercetin dioxygenase-like cupin family protein